MDDRFKFRAWDMADELMYYDVQFGIMFDDRSHYPFERFLGNQDDGDYHEWELMQCTGLKDKNGELIYEGDIVELGHCKYGKYFAVVKFIAGCFQHYPVNQPGINSNILNAVCHTAKIVGNIYENRDLIAGK